MCLFFNKSTSYYVSSSIGNDKNSGSESAPFKTIAKALSKNPTKIYLKKGDTFYESFEDNLCNVEVTSYGYGNKPVVSGKKTYYIINSYSDNIYRVNLNSDLYSGFTTNTICPKWYNNIGAIINGKSRRCYSIEGLKENWDFYIDEDTQYLYVYSEEPIYALYVSVGSFAMENIKNCKVNGIRFEYWGRHCITAKSNVSITNCEFYYIGGSRQENYAKSSTVQYGNGIEFWLGDAVGNAEIINCVFDNIYDSSITIQGDKPTNATNIIFKNNIIKNQCSSIENFKQGVGEYINCVYEGNKCFNNGIKFHSWRHLNPEDRQVRSGHISKGLENNTELKGCPILKNNIFIGGSFYWGGYQDYCLNQNIFDGNVVYILRGEQLFKKRVKGADMIIEVPLNPANDNEVILAYQTETGDFDTIFNFIDTQEELNKIIGYVSQTFN